MSITENIKTLRNEIPKHVTLVAVSKTKPNEAIIEAYEAGQRVFGENKIQEMVAKWEALPKDISWHMIGHVQRNKVKYMAPFVDLIHGVDSYKLLSEINKQAAKHDRVIDCLLQIHIAEEDTKFGMTQEEAESILTDEKFSDMKNIKVVGLMGMATFTNNTQQVKDEFHKLYTIYNSLKTLQPSINVLSMGMSGDYELAIQEGSTMVRVGSRIFGARNYSH